METTGGGHTNALGAHEPISILIVDDKPKLLDALRRLFRTIGSTVDGTTNSEDALDAAQRKAAQQEPFDLVLIDLRLDPDSGLDLIVDLRRVSPTTVVLLFSGFLERADIDEAKRRGAADAIAKPFTRDEIFAAYDRARGVPLMQARWQANP